VKPAEGRRDHNSFPTAADGSRGARTLRNCLEAEDPGPVKSQLFNPKWKGDVMDSTLIIRVVSGVLFVVILAVLVWRRKSTA